MQWESGPQTWPQVSLDQVPPSLIDALERNSGDARIQKVRLRWRPRRTNARRGFVTRDRLVDLEGQDCEAIAISITSHARHLYLKEPCEDRFEAQVQRMLENGEEQWRSITFYLPGVGAQRSAAGVSEDRPEFEDEFLFKSRPAPFTPPPPAAQPAPAFNYKDYEEFVELSRSDPTAFAMLVIQQSHDQTVGLLRDLLYASTYRVDSILSTQVSGSRYLNEALNTITHGAGRIANLGVSLFEHGLESRARVAKEERETVLGRERNEITRDAIKQGSLLVQTIVMANAAKRNQQEREQDVAPARAASTARRGAPQGATVHDEHPAAAEPTLAKTALELDIEAKTERFLELLQHEPIDELRMVAPTLSAFFDRLARSAVDGARILELIKDAEKTVEREELMKVHTLVSAELASAFANLMMRAMSEQS